MAHLTVLVHVGIVLALSRPIAPAQVKAMQNEASALWRSYGVQLTWFDREDDCSSAATIESLPPVDVLLRVVTDGEPDPRSFSALDESLAFVEFARGVPSPTMHLRYAPLERLVLDARFGGWMVRSLPVPLRDQLLGRALGRVLSHELGHVLLAMPAHTGVGLMRPSFSTSDLLSAAREHLRLSRSAATRLSASQPRRF